MDRGDWGGYSPQGHKELDKTEETQHARTARYQLEGRNVEGRE